MYPSLDINRFSTYFCPPKHIIGMWRSPVAHTPGGRGVAGSNPVIPTKKEISHACLLSFFGSVSPATVAFQNPASPTKVKTLSITEQGFLMRNDF